ncbi:hypothetical protein EYF88_14600 [Paracoccus sediminis]|uniref:5-deoxyglucuronate isomerase n=1 Tax=Paracoccus sediminis TaxID=1214787 RepID=A0A238XSL4_9RHOB|nr:hypothetical protein [Paracoccus sediminis]TBN47870.1 hypothetical protein EYF88_14600 [Paracoccus sediminis]SNR61917.1 hypothetical protein SAMN06265378_11238 [Paracoccus sediminis]
MYTGKDPRADLFAATTKPPATGLIAEDQLALFYGTPPQAEGVGWKSWYHRGNNFVLAYSEAAPGAVFARDGQPDEYVVYLPDAAHGAVIEAGDERVAVPGYRIAFVPPGDSRVTLPEGGVLVRLFTTRSTDLAEAASNARAYDAARTHIPPFEAWPAPKHGFRVRHYSLDVPAEPGRFGRIFRCTTFMVNIFEPQKGPRDTTRMSPHHHDDFEQCSLALKGKFVHHLRWPWTVDMADWRDDRHVEVGSPSSLVIPPPVIHTTRAMDAADNDLVDIFCPPRMDFSLKPGWVLNAEDYPLPKD